MPIPPEKNESIKRPNEDLEIQDNSSSLAIISINIFKDGDGKSDDS